MISVRGLTRTYPGSPPRVALAGVTLDIERGSWVVLLGPNGSGKSTLLRTLCGLEPVQAGNVSVLGEPVGGSSTRSRRARARVGVVFQRPGLDPLLTGRENLRTQAALHGLCGREPAARIERIARDLGIGEVLALRVGAMSGGWARRVDLARALIAEPEVLLLDEPTTGLDHEARAGFLDALGRQRCDAGRTILMSTHLMDEAERADRVVMLAEGRVAAEGSPAELRRRAGRRLVCDGGAPGGSPAGLAIEVLRRAGLAAERGEGGSVVARVNPEAEALIEPAIVELVRAGLDVHLSRPTLADAYLDAAGRSLDARHEPPARAGSTGHA